MFDTSPTTVPSWPNKNIAATALNSFVRVVSAPQLSQSTGDTIDVAFEYGGFEDESLTARIEAVDDYSIRFAHKTIVLKPASSVYSTSLGLDSVPSTNTTLQVIVMVAPSHRIQTYGFVWSEEGVATGSSKTKYVADVGSSIAPLQLVLGVNRAIVMTSEASHTSFRARLFQELFHGVDRVQMAAAAAVRNTTTLTITAYGEEVLVEVAFNVNKAASAEIQRFVSSMTKAVKKCHFCIVFEGQLSCAHGKDTGICVPPQQCANNPCRSDTVCKPRTSTSDPFFCACPNSFSVANCTTTSNGGSMMPEVMVDSTSSIDNVDGQLSFRDVAIIIVVISLIAVSTLLLVHRIHKPPNREKFTSDFGSEFNNDFNAAFSPVFSPNGVPIIGQTTLEWEEEVWDTPGHKTGKAKANPMFRDSVRRTEPHPRQSSSSASESDSNYVASEAGTDHPGGSVATSEGYTDFDDLAPFAAYQNQFVDKLVWDNHYDPNTQRPIGKERAEPGFTRTDSDHTALSSNESHPPTIQNKSPWPAALQQMGDDIFRDMSAASIAAHLHEGTAHSPGSKRQPHESTLTRLRLQPTPKPFKKRQVHDSASTLDDYIDLGKGDEYALATGDEDYSFVLPMDCTSPTNFHVGALAMSVADSDESEVLKHWDDFEHFEQELEHASGLVVERPQKSGHLVVNNEGLAHGGTSLMMELHREKALSALSGAYIVDSMPAFSLTDLGKTAQRPKEPARKAGSCTNIDAALALDSLTRAPKKSVRKGGSCTDIDTALALDSLTRVMAPKKPVKKAGSCTDIDAALALDSLTKAMAPKQPAEKAASCTDIDALFS